MTLGRTSSGAIKIKTDGGLRAVNCACCGGCGCGSVAVSGDLLAVFENMLTYPPYSGSGSGPPPGYPSLPTCFGMPPDFFMINADGFNFQWDFVGPGGRGPIFAGVDYSKIDKCLYVSGQKIFYETFTFQNVLLSGQLEGCCPPDYQCSVADDILINDKAIPAFNIITYPGRPLVDQMEFFFP